MPKNNLLLYAIVFVMFIGVAIHGYNVLPSQFNILQHIISGIILLVIASIGLKSPEINLREAGIPRIAKVLFGSIIITFLSWLLIGVVVQPLLGGVVFEMASTDHFLLSMTIFVLALYPVMNKYLL